MEYISQFATNIQYVREDSNVVANTLSRAFELDAFKFTG